jgi:hypothetical protein
MATNAQSKIKIYMALSNLNQLNEFFETISKNFQYRDPGKFFKTEISVLVWLKTGFFGNHALNFILLIYFESVFE